MAVDKFSVSLPEELVASVDEIAAAGGLTRSAVIREATAEYVTRRATGEYAAERRRRVDAALAGFDRIAKEWGPDERSATDLLRELRESENASGE